MAARDVIAELQVNLSMETAAFARGAGVAETRAKTMEGRLGALSKRANAASGALTGLAGGFLAGLGTAAVAGIGTAVVAGLDYASSLGEVATQLGVTTKELQTYRYAATQAGIEQSEMDKSLAKLTKTLGDAALGSSSAQAPFEKLGISLKNADGSAKSAGQVIPEIAEKLKGIANPAERAALLTDLFGKSGQKLLPLLGDGAKGVNELTSAAEKLGIVISDEQIAKADEAADKWAAYKQVLSSKIAIGAVEGLDGLTAAGNFLDKWSAGTAASIQDFKNSIRTGGENVSWFVDLTKRRFGELPGAVSSNLSRMVDSVRGWLGSKLDAATANVDRVTTRVGDSFRAMYIRVVGNSDVPDMVNEVGDWFAKLDGVMVPATDAAAKKVGDRFAKLRGELKTLMADLFPEFERAQEIEGQLRTLASGEASGLLTGDQAAEARKRVFGAQDLEQVPFVADAIEKLGVSVEDILPSMNKLGDNTEGLASRYEDIAQSLVNVIGSLFGGSKTGRLVGAVLQAGVGLAKSFGAFGGARAKGGPVVPGKTYLVGEKGPEFVTPNRRGYVQPNGKGGFGGSTRLSIVPSQYFEVVVDGRAQRIAAPMAGRAAVAGAAGGMAGIARQRQRSLVG